MVRFGQPCGLPRRRSNPGARDLKQTSGKEFIRILQSRGWNLVRTKGSHHILTKIGHRERIVVPVHRNQPLKLGLLKAQMKIAGLTENDL